MKLCFVVLKKNKIQSRKSFKIHHKILRSPKLTQMAGSASTAKPGSVAFRESAKPGKDHLDINIIFRDQDKYKDGWHIQTKTKTPATKRRTQAKRESEV